MTPAPVEIRPVRTADRDFVLATVRATDLLSEEGITEVAAELGGVLGGRREGGLWLVATSGADVAGVAYCVEERMTEGTWNLLMLAVHPAHQGRGLGSALVHGVEHDLRSRGARLLVVETSGVAGFAAQRRFYEHLGYRQQGWIEDFFEPGDAKVVHARSLIADRAPADRAPGDHPPADRAAGVRMATTADLDRLTQLAAAFYADDGFSTTPTELAANLRSLVCAHDARVALMTGPATDAPTAFAVTTTGFGLENGLIAELEDLYVAPDFRRRGLGTTLVEDAAAWARARGCAQLEVVIAPNGRDVEHLDKYYAALGFTDSGRTLRSRDLSPAR